MTERRKYTDDYQDKTLYIPGSTEMRKDVIAEMCQPVFGHRMDHMTDLYTTITEDTKEFLGTDNGVMILAGSGTEIWESSTLNLAGENTLVPTCRSFSECHANVAECPGKSVDRIEYEQGQAIRPEDICEALESSGRQCDVVAVVMNESSTGIHNPIEEIGDAIVKYPDTYLVADTVLALGGDYVDIDKHSIDVIFASPQRAFAMPPGLAICTVSDEAYKREPSKDSTSRYGDFQRALDYYDHKGQIHSTPVIPIMLTYHKQMKHMLEEGHESRDRHHRKVTEYTREWTYEYFGMFPEEGYESQAVACIENTQGIDVATAIEGVNKEYDMMFLDSYDSALRGKTSRIDHMGKYDTELIKAPTDAIKDVADL